MLRELEEEARARGVLEQAYGVALSIKDQQGVAESLRQLGSLYYLQGDGIAYWNCTAMRPQWVQPKSKRAGR